MNSLFFHRHTHTHIHIDTSTHNVEFEMNNIFLQSIVQLSILIYLYLHSSTLAHTRHIEQRGEEKKKFFKHFHSNRKKLNELL